MSGFGNISSAFPSMNDLLAPQYLNIQQQQQANRNQLMPYQLQQEQQKVGSADMEVAARVAGTLMDPTLYPTTEARAAAYPGLISDWQSRGYLKNAPSVYPGDAQAAALARMGTSSEKQAEWAANIAANRAYTGATTPSAAPGAAGGGGGVPPPGGNYGAGGPGGSIQVPAEYMPFYREASERTGIPVEVLIAKDRQESGFNPNAKGKAGEIGIAQIMPSTALAPGYGMQPVDPAKLTDPRTSINFGADYLKARMRGDPKDPEAMRRGLFAYNAGGDPNYVANVTRYLPASYGAAPAAAPPAAPGGQPGRFPPGTVQTAGPGAGTPPAAAPDTGGATVAYPGRPEQDVPGPPQNGLLPGAPGNPPTAAPPPAPTQQAAGGPPQPPAMQPPAGGPQAPPVTPLNAHGLTAQQQQGIDTLAATGRLSLQDRIKLEQQYQTFNIQQAQKQFSDYLQLQQLAVSQGQLSNAQFEANLKAWQAAHPELAPNARVDTLAYRTMQELAPVIQSGNASDEQKEQYANAVTKYRGYEQREDPMGGGLIRVAKNPLPPGFPAPANDLGDVQRLTPGYSPQEQAIRANPSGYKVAVTDYERDAKEMPAITDTVKAAQQDQIRIAEMQGILQELASGPGRAGIEHAKAWLQANLPSAVNPFSEQAANLSGPAAAEVFQKLAFKGSVAQERQSSSRGGYAVTKLFQQLNPGMDLLNPSNANLLNAQLISNQADIDYGSAANQFYLNQKDRFRNTSQYDPQQYFEQKWIDQRNPQVYNAAIMALNGNTKWWDDPKNGRLSDDEYARALQIMQRAKPAATIQTKNGPYSLQPAAVTTGAQPSQPGNRVIRFDHNGNPIQ